MVETTQYLQVDTNASLVRDAFTGAIINTSSSELEEYKKRRSANLRMREEIKRNAEEILVIKGELSEIKSMIIQLLTKE